MAKRDKSIFDRLASVRLTVLLIALLAASSIIGTLILQNQPERVYVERFGPGLFKFFNAFGLFDLYHSWWFRLLIAVLAVNLIVCSLKRLPKALKIMGLDELAGGPGKLVNFQNNFQMDLKRGPEELKPGVEAAFSRLGSPRWKEIEGGWLATFSRGKIGRLGPYVVHLSVLLIIAGSLVGSIFGFKGYIQIAEGEETNRVGLNMGHAAVELPFSIRLDKFTVKFYDTGMPKEFRSDVVVSEKGRKVKSASILVNDPMDWRGVRFYQSSYSAIPKTVDLKLTPGEGEPLKVRARYREPIKVSPGLVLRVVDFKENIQNFGPAVAIMAFPENARPHGSWILVKHPSFHGNRIHGYHVEVASFDTGYVSGLQVTRDPGVWVIYTGFIIIIIGSYMAFFISHIRVWVFLKPGEKTTSLTAAGVYSRNPIGFEAMFSEGRERLEHGKGENG
jgi:cytochrome c biogenesis protein